MHSIYLKRVSQKPNKFLRELYCQRNHMHYSIPLRVPSKAMVSWWDWKFHGRRLLWASYFLAFSTVSHSYTNTTYSECVRQMHILWKQISESHLDSCQGSLRLNGEHLLEGSSGQHRLMVVLGFFLFIYCNQTFAEYVAAQKTDQTHSSLSGC